MNFSDNMIDYPNSKVYFKNLLNGLKEKNLMAIKVIDAFDKFIEHYKQ